MLGKFTDIEPPFSLVWEWNCASGWSEAGAGSRLISIIQGLWTILLIPCCLPVIHYVLLRVLNASSQPLAQKNTKFEIQLQRQKSQETFDSHQWVWVFNWQELDHLREWTNQNLIREDPVSLLTKRRSSKRLEKFPTLMWHDGLTALAAAVIPPLLIKPKFRIQCLLSHKINSSSFLWFLFWLQLWSISTPAHCGFTVWQLCDHCGQRMLGNKEKLKITTVVLEEWDY